MEGKRVIQSIAVKNLLSYGSEGVELKLQPLNVLIGPNGSGKSNLLEMFRLLQALPQDVSTPVVEGGGINEWVWKGANRNGLIQLSVHLDTHPFRHLTHHFIFMAVFNKLLAAAEYVYLEETEDQQRQMLYGFVNGEAHIASRQDKAQGTAPYEYDASKLIDRKDFLETQSILAQRSDPVIYPDLFLIANTYKQIRLYADVNFGRNTPAREPQKADLDNTYLFEDGSNLALVINDLQNRPGVMRDIITRLKRFNPRVQDIITRVSYGTVQLYIEEEGLEQTIPATRFSDGTLRYLFLLVLLCHPEPPPVICIEEPELGLHPDMIRSIAELLVEASQRTQVIVTTHSDLLVSALSETPEAIVVCEHNGESSTLRRLQPDKLNLWLEQYSLGELWLKGEIGGTRW